MKPVESRYSYIKEGSRPEEIVLLQGMGCFWKHCTFCDYYLDSDSKEKVTRTNQKVLKQITGRTGRLTVLNSGSFFELPKSSRDKIIEICREKNIKDLTIESHWFYRERVKELREKLKKFGIKLHARIGIETFDINFREKVLKKGLNCSEVDKITEYFDECCLLFGISGQNLDTLKNDINTAVNAFKDVYLNIYEPIAGLSGDSNLIERFKEELLPEIEKIGNLHILIENTDLGVG